MNFSYTQQERKGRSSFASLFLKVWLACYIYITAPNQVRVLEEAELSSKEISPSELLK